MDPANAVVNGQLPPDGAGVRGATARSSTREAPVAVFVVLAAAASVAIVSARGYAGSWNDGSRLATVESLVDRHTLAIDDSIFVQVPTRGDPTAPLPYPRQEPDLLLHGTRDRLFINGHYYSDKSPVPAVILAIWYQSLRWVVGLSARERPDRFCYWMTLGSSGLAYVIAVWCIFQLGRALQLGLPLRVLLTASFGLATVSLTYARQVNSHIWMLAVGAALMRELAWLAEDAPTPRRRRLLLVVRLGTLAGLGYTVDLGSGPLLLLCTLALVAYRDRSVVAVASFTLAALPWLVLHHALNYAIGGTFRPANAVPDYFSWPGSPFGLQNISGVWHQQSIVHFAIYAAALLLGKRGFLDHNLALFLVVPGCVMLLRQGARERAEIIFAGCWCTATWLVYAATSNNYSGVCASIRWFVPLLAPAYFVLAVWLRDHPPIRLDFAVLSSWGLVLAGLMWLEGPWMKHTVPFFWPLQVAALASWAACWVWRTFMHRPAYELNVP